MTRGARVGRNTDTTFENFLRPEALQFDDILWIGGRQRAPLRLEPADPSSSPRPEQPPPTVITPSFLQDMWDCGGVR